MADYVPRSDPEFDVWQAALVTYATTNAGALCLGAGDLAMLTGDQAPWTAAYPAHLTAATAANAARADKDAKRATYETTLRQTVRKIQACLTTNDAARAAMRITIADEVATPPGPPTSKPVGIVDTSQRQRHILSFADEGTPTKKAKPAGVFGCQIYRVVKPVGAAPPTGIGECTLIATDSETPYLAEYDPSQAGMTAHYILRWVNKDGEPGPISETLSATIVA